MSDIETKDRERLEAFERELTQDPRSLVFIALAEEHNRLSRFDDAASVAQKGLVYHPDSVAGRLALALAESGRNNVRQALEQIKRALLIDPDSPKALGLMGRILLQKGLAKRAMQFLNHAVKLAPSELEYAELLKRAKRTVQAESPPPSPPPQMEKGDKLRDLTSPWSALSDDPSDSEFNVRPPDAEHTVFDPEALKKLRQRDRAKGGENGDLGFEDKDASLEETLAQLGDDMETDEPTRFDGRGRKPPLKLPDGDPPARANEEPTTFDTKNPLNDPRKKPKLGGSAAEFSQMMRQIKETKDQGGDNGHAPGPPSPPPPPDLEVPPTLEADALKIVKGDKVKSGNVKTGSPPKEAPPPPERDKAKEKEAAKKEAKEAAKPAAPDPIQKSVGTRMVDEALWALLGGKASSSPKPSPDADKKDKKKDEKGSAEAKDKDKDKGHAKAEGKAAAGPMVVRTSERFGTVFRASVLLVLIVSSTWLGYALAVSSGGAPPEVASEEVKGIAADLERGGLARLIAAEERVLTLLPSLPQLSDLLTGALAEIYARRWASFGHDPEMLSKAREKLEALKGSDATVELLAARVALSTSAAERAQIDNDLERSLKSYPDSPKTWVLRSRIALLDGRGQDAEDDLYAARAINPQHRMTLLELARWHARQGTYPAAFSYYDQLQASYPEDVEVAIERYVLGQVSGRDPAESQATATLAGLVRQEVSEVAKDEAGRVALAFALPLLARGEYEKGIEELGKADGAFDSSAEFKAAVAGMDLAIGQWDRARRHYERALAIEPNNSQYRLGIARASFGERAKLKPPPKAAGEAKWSGGVAQLPFATVRFVLGRFALVNVDPNREIFPEAGYAAAMKAYRGAELRDALESSTLVALALEKLKTNAVDDAMGFLDEAQKLKDDASVRVAFGRAFLAKKDSAMATRQFKRALEMDRDNVQARIGLAAVLEKRNDLAGAIEALETIEKNDAIVPQAMAMLARLRMQKGDYERALPALETVALLLPRDAQAQMQLGEVQHKMKKPEDAFDSYRRAVKISPRLLDKPSDKASAVTLLYLGRLELERDEAKGIALLKKSAKLEDAPEAVHFYLGKTLVKNKKTKKQGRKELETYRSQVSSGELYEEAGRLLR